MQQVQVQAGQKTGSSFVAGVYEITPEAIVFSIRWGNAGFVWNWPVGLTVRYAGHTERATITDPTRVVLWALWLLTLCAGLSGLIALLKPRRRNNG
jgi:hypothetical protein